MGRKKLCGCAVLAVGLAALVQEPSASALTANLPNCLCTYSVPNLNVSGDNWYSGLSVWAGGSSTWCSGTMFTLAGNYGFNGWGSGWGTYECDNTKPFARTMNAITALATASPNTITGTLYQFQTAAFPLLDWAYLWTANKMDDTRGKCEHGDLKQFNAAEGGGAVKLYIRRSGSCNLGFFHGNDAAERAGIMVHETRHIGGPSHYNTYQDFAFGGGGAYEFEATWLQQYAQGSVSSPLLLRCSAANRAQAILNGNFVIPPPAFTVPAGC